MWKNSHMWKWHEKSIRKNTYHSMYVYPYVYFLQSLRKQENSMFKNNPRVFPVIQCGNYNHKNKCIFFNNFFNDKKKSSDKEAKEKENPSYCNSSFHNRIMIIYNDILWKKILHHTYFQFVTLTQHINTNNQTMHKQHWLLIQIFYFYYP